MDILAALGLEVDSRPVARADQALDRFQRSARGAERGAVGFERGARGMALSAARVAGAVAGMVASVASLGAMVTVIADFDRSMSQVEAITRASSQELEAMRAIAMDLGATTAFSAAQAADGLRFLGMAGFSASEAMAAIPDVLNLASASGMDLAETADIASNIMSAFAIDAGQAGNVADVLAAASSRANTNVAQLGQAMSYAGPTAAALGISMETTAAAIGVMSDAGIQGSRAGTALNAALASLAAPTDQAAAALAGLGVDVASVNPATADLVDIIDALAGGGMDAASAMAIFGREAGPAMLALVSQNDRLRDLRVELGGVAGEAGRMAQIMNDNLRGDFLALGSAAQGLALALGDAGITAALRAVVQAATATVRGISAVVQAIGDLRGYAIAAAAVFTVMYAPALYAAATASWAFIASLITMRTVMISTGVGALVVGLGFLINQFLRMVEATGSVGGAIQMLSDLASEVFTERMPMFVMAGVVRMQAWWNEMKSTFLQAVHDMSSALAGFMTAAAAAYMAIPGMSLLGTGLLEAAEALQTYRGEIQATATEFGNLADQQIRTSATLIRYATRPLDSLQALRDHVAATGTEAQDTGELVDELNDALTNLASPEGGAAAAGAALEEAATRAEAFREAMADAADTAEEFGRNQANIMVRGVDSIASAFGNFVARGFRDFRGFVDAVLSSFQNMLAQMIALAARNRILIGLGFSGGGVAAAGQAMAGAAGGGGGLLGNIFGLGGGGGFLGSVGSSGGILGMGGLGGGTGLLGGLGNALSGGIGNLFSIGANAAAAGGGLAASIGAALPVIGIAAAAFSLLRTRTKETNNGLRITIGEFGVLAEQFREIKRVSAFGGRSYTTTYSAASAETQAFVEETVGNLKAGVIAAAGALGFASEMFEGFAETFNVSFYGLSEQEAQAALEAALYGMADGMAALVPGLQEFAKEGEGAYDTLNRLASSLTSVNFWMGNLGLTVQEIGLAGASAASNFADLFGSIDAFNSAAQAYYQSFYSDSERLRRATELMAAEFLALGIDVMPRTRSQFRDLVEAADAAGDTELVAALIQLAPAFADITQEVNALDRALNGQSMFRTLADQVYADTSQGYRKSISEVLDEAGDETAQLLRDVITAIREGDLNNARIQSKLLAIQQRAELEPSA